MSQADFARHRGVQRSAVTHWKRRDLLVWVEGPGGKQLVDVAATDAKVNAALDPGRGRPPSESSPAAAPAAVPLEDSLSKARSELMREQIARERMRNDRAAGSLVPLQEFERRAAEAGRLVRERVHGVIRELAERLAAEADPRKLRALLAEAMDSAFESLASEIEGQADAEAIADAVLAEAEVVSEAELEDVTAA